MPCASLCRNQRDEVHAFRVDVIREGTTCFGGVLDCPRGDNGDVSSSRQLTEIRLTNAGEVPAQIKPSVPFVVRLDGTNDEEGRRLLAEADLPNVHTEATMLDAARRVVELAG